jgi:uncharacterized C2H2 Zn-finger protein
LVGPTLNDTAVHREDANAWGTQISPQPFTNNQVLSLAKKYIRPSLEWENFELADQKAVLKAPRCNPIFNTSKLFKKLGELGYRVKDTHEALEDTFVEMGKRGYSEPASK